MYVDYSDGYKESDEFNNDKKILFDGIDAIRKVLNCYSTRIVYNVKNYRCYVILKINTIKMNKYKKELMNELEKNYHLEFVSINDKITQLELHVKNINTFFFRKGK